MDAAAAEAKRSVTAPLEAQISTLQDLLTVSNNQVQRLVTAAALAASKDSDDKRRAAADILVTEIREAQGREHQLLARVHTLEEAAAVVDT